MPLFSLLAPYRHPLDPRFLYGLCVCFLYCRRTATLWIPVFLWPLLLFSLSPYRHPLDPRFFYGLCFCSLYCRHTDTLWIPVFSMASAPVLFMVAVPPPSGSPFFLWPLLLCSLWSPYRHPLDPRFFMASASVLFIVAVPPPSGSPFFLWPKFQFSLLSPYHHPLDPRFFHGLCFCSLYCRRTATLGIRVSAIPTCSCLHKSQQVRVSRNIVILQLPHTCSIRRPLWPSACENCYGFGGPF